MESRFLDFDDNFKSRFIDFSKDDVDKEDTKKKTMHDFSTVQRRVFLSEFMIAARTKKGE